MKAFTYLRTSSSDSKDKMGLPVQREGCNALAARLGFEIEQEFADDITGKIHLHARPQGKLLIAALLGNGVKHVLCYDGNRIGRDQPVFWRAVEMFRDNGIALLDRNGTNLCESVQGAFSGLMSEVERNSIVARLAAGKAIAKSLGKRIHGRFAFGADPRKPEEKATKTRMQVLSEKGLTDYAVAKQLDKEGLKSRMGGKWSVKAVTNILHGRKEKTND